MNFLYYLSAEELVSRGNAVLCILLPNTHLSSRYFNQADLKASPHSSSCQDRFPEVNAVRQEARDCTVHTIGSSSPLSSPLPNLAGLCFSPHLSSSQGWGAWLGPWQPRLHYRDVTKQGDQPARPKRPRSLSHSPAETFALFAVQLTLWYLSKTHYRHFRTVCPKVTGFMGGFVVFYLLLVFVLKSCLYPHLMENVPLG